MLRQTTTVADLESSFHSDLDGSFSSQPTSRFTLDSARAHFAASAVCTSTKEIVDSSVTPTVSLPTGATPGLAGSTSSIASALGIGNSSVPGLTVQGSAGQSSQSTPAVDSHGVGLPQQTITLSQGNAPPGSSSTGQAAGPSYITQHGATISSSHTLNPSTPQPQAGGHASAQHSATLSALQQHLSSPGAAHNPLAHSSMQGAGLGQPEGTGGAHTRTLTPSAAGGLLPLTVTGQLSKTPLTPDNGLQQAGLHTSVPSLAQQLAQQTTSIPQQQFPGQTLRGQSTTSLGYSSQGAAVSHDRASASHQGASLGSSQHSSLASALAAAPSLPPGSVLTRHTGGLTSLQLSNGPLIDSKFVYCDIVMLVILYFVDLAKYNRNSKITNFNIFTPHVCDVSDVIVLTSSVYLFVCRSVSASLSRPNGWTYRL